MATFIFMSMDLQKFIIIIKTKVLVIPIINTSALKVYSNLPEAILFIFTCLEPFSMRVHNVIAHIFKVTLLTFCKISLIHYSKNKKHFPMSLLILYKFII